MPTENVQANCSNSTKETGNWIQGQIYKDICHLRKHWDVYWGANHREKDKATNLNCPFGTVYSAD